MYNRVTHGIFLQSIVWLVYICEFVSYSIQYNTITLFKEGDVIALNSFLTYGPLKEFCNQHCSWGRLKKLCGENLDKFSHWEWSTKLSDSETLSVQRVTKINFLFTISIYDEKKRVWELKKWSLKGKCCWSFFKYHCKEMYRDQSGEFGFGCRLLHWLAIFPLILNIYYCV